MTGKTPVLLSDYVTDYRRFEEMNWHGRSICAKSMRGGPPSSVISSGTSRTVCSGVLRMSRFCCVGTVQAFRGLS